MMLRINKLPRPALATRRTHKFSDKTVHRLYDDGSWRRDAPKVRGNAAVKKAKRARQKAMR